MLVRGARNGLREGGKRVAGERARRRKHGKKKDRKKVRKRGVHAVFLPDVNESMVLSDFPVSLGFPGKQIKK